MMSEAKCPNGEKRSAQVTFVKSNPAVAPDVPVEHGQAPAGTFFIISWRPGGRLFFFLLRFPPAGSSLASSCSSRPCSLTALSCLPLFVGRPRTTQLVYREKITHPRPHYRPAARRRRRDVRHFDWLFWWQSLTGRRLDERRAAVDYWRGGRPGPAVDSVCPARGPGRL